MSDTEQTGAERAASSEQASTPAQPAVTPAAEITAAESSTTAAPSTPNGAFGTTRGAGLARGKRPSNSSAQASSKAAEYKPTAIEVVKTSTAFANPFAPEPVATPAPEPEVVKAEPTPAPAPAPEISTPETCVAPTPVSSELPSSPVTETVSQETNKQPDAETAEDNASLNILPPAETRRPAQSWENRPERREREDRPRREDRGGFRGDRRERRDDRPTFKPERRPLPPQNENRPQPSVQEPAKPAKKSGGLLGWLKGLFSSKEEAKPEASQDRPRRDGDQNRRNRRHHGYSRDGERGGQVGGQHREGGRPFQGGGEGGDQGGQRRRRRRGGRGRQFGGDRGEGRGGPDSSSPRQD